MARIRTESVMLETVEYTSDALPGVPSFEIGVPAGWEIDTHADQLAVMVDPCSSPEFRVNVIVGVDRVESSLTLEEVVAGVTPPADDGASTPEPVDSGSKIGTLGGLPAGARLQSLAVEEPSVELTQLEVVLLAPDAGGPTRHLFSIHATCLATSLDQYLPAFAAIIRSLHFL